MNDLSVVALTRCGGAAIEARLALLNALPLNATSKNEPLPSRPPEKPDAVPNALKAVASTRR